MMARCKLAKPPCAASSACPSDWSSAPTPAFRSVRLAESHPPSLPAPAVAEVAGDEPAVVHPFGGFDGAAGPGVLRGPALRGDGKVFGAGVPGEPGRLRASRRAQTAR